MNKYEVYLYEVKTFLVGYEISAKNEGAALNKGLRAHKNFHPIEEKLIDIKAGQFYKCYLVESKVKKPKKKKAKSCDIDGSSYEYSHVACPSYPNCDEDPNGCRLGMGDDVEEYGMRD